jgi:hypothetical protein
MGLVHGKDVEIEERKWRSQKTFLRFWLEQPATCSCHLLIWVSPERSRLQRRINFLFWTQFERPIMHLQFMFMLTARYKPGV